MPAQHSVQSRTGSISVTATEHGVLTQLGIDQHELTRPPQELADEILALCKLSAMRQQVARRQEILREPYGPEIVRAMELPTPEQLEAAEEAVLDFDEQPVTWMRRV